MTDLFQKVILMTEALQRLSQANSTDTHNITFSAALAAGLTHSGWLVGPTTDPSGQEAALVSHLALPERVEGLKTSVTFGPLFGGSSPSADLQSSLESRLRLLLGANGSPEYELTWKSWDMQSGPPICALRASVRRISDSGCSGWPTPNTPNGGRATPPGTSTTGMTPDGKKRQVALENVVQTVVAMVPLGDEVSNPEAMSSMQVQLAGWPTPNHNTTGAGNQGREGGLNLQTASKLVKLRERAIASGLKLLTENEVLEEVMRRRTGNQECTCPIHGQTPSSSLAPTENGGGCLAGWCSPTAQDHSRGVKPPRPHDTGVPLTQQVANLERWVFDKHRKWNPTLKLNYRFSLWLQGYPIEWASCGERVTR
jgi:hypothetical protein